MAKTPITPEFPLRPIGDGETLVQLFRSAAEQSAAAGEHDVTPGPRSVPPRRSRTTVPSLQRRLYEADGRPVRLGRYEVERCVGSGGMGVVYEAVNLEHGHRVALKTLRWMTAQGLSRFKNEFRSLCGVSHPNLVALYELGVEDDEWFFTMELVEGQSFLEHVQGDGARVLAAWEYLGETLDEGTHPGERDGDAAIEESAVFSRRGFHEARLRGALRQLASAVAAIHALGKLHRDLNPGNVLVTREGRVVVLDFGLISDRTHRPGVPYDGASGTPAYMSPEQAAGKPATPASDWYGFGVMLFEALTGQLPFIGSTLRMLTNKRYQEAPPPSALVPGLPADLDDLCSGLLRRAPEERPDADAVLHRLGVAPRRARRTAPGGESVFVGRGAELEALGEAQRAVATGLPVAVVVHGPAGIGKTSLLARFLDDLAGGGAAIDDAGSPGAAGSATRAPILLHGACGERETIPYRLLDAAIDALATHLVTLPAAEVRAVLPPAGRELARAFPVLEGLEAIAELPPPADPDAGDGAAFACLRELLIRLAAGRPVVLAIDDAHLGDAGDARTLAELLATPDGPGVLLLVSHASEELEASPVLAALSRAFPDLRHVVLGPLSAGEAQELSGRALPADLPADTDADAVAALIAAASGGSPLAVEELALHFTAGGGEVSLGDAIAARLADLSGLEHRLVEIAAAADRPIERGVLFTVAGAGPAGDAALASLTANRVLRARGVRSADLVRVHDERVRAAVAARTSPPVVRQIHLDLGRALAAWPGADPVVAAAYFHRAGASALAAAHLGAAAEHAAAAGAWDGAAELWGRALEGMSPGSEAARALSLRRGDALAAAGRSAAAASAYLLGIGSAPPAEALDRRRRAAEHLIVAGHIDDGMAALRAMLEAHGVRWPASPHRALWTLATCVVDLCLRGTGLPDEGASRGVTGPGAGARQPIAPGHAARIDALWSAGKSLTGVDPLRSAVFVTEALREALAAGDAARAAPALALMGSMLVYQGSAAAEARGIDFIEEAARFARRSGDGDLLGFSWFCSGLARMCAGRFREALARIEESLGMLEARGARLAWEHNAHLVVALQVLFELGDLAERGRRAEAWLRDARDRDDRAGEVHAALAVALSHLAGDDPSRTRERIREARALAWRGGFGVPQQMALWLEVSSLLYEGDAAAARSRLRAAWPALAASQLLRIQLVRIEALHLRGLTAVAAGGADLRLAEGDAARLSRERRPHALAASALLRAGVARGRGEVARASAAFDEAARTYASAEMRVHAATARRARGALLGGAEGRALVAGADAVLAAEGVRDGRRWAAMYTGCGGGR